MDEPKSSWSLASFRGSGYDKGRGTAWQAAWFACQNLIFIKWWCPRRLRVTLLRLFGAQVGSSTFIRHRVRVLWPWKLAIGDNVWIGEDAWILNLESVSIGHDVCLSQGAFICTGSHDRRSPTFEYDNAPIIIEHGVWIATQAIVLRGVVIGAGSVVGAGSIITHDLAAGSVTPALTRT